jgi:hypothetical protein
MPKPREARAEAIMSEVMAALQGLGASTQIVATGAAALLVGFEGISFVLVVRTGIEMSHDQINWTSRWRGGWCVVGNAKQAVLAARRIVGETMRVKPRDVTNDFVRKAGNAR